MLVCNKKEVSAKIIDRDPLSSESFTADSPVRPLISGIDDAFQPRTLCCGGDGSRTHVSESKPKRTTCLFDYS